MMKNATSPNMPRKSAQANPVLASEKPSVRLQKQADAVQVAEAKVRDQARCQESDL